MRIVFPRIQNMRTDISILKQLIHSKFEMVSIYLMGRRFLALGIFRSWNCKAATCQLQHY